MQVHEEIIHAQQIVFMRRVGAYGEENYKLMQDMKAWIQSQNLWCENGAIYTIAHDDIKNTQPEQCRYDVCFVTNKDVEDSDIHHGVLPSGAYLVFEILHTADEVQLFWDSIGETLAKEKK